MSQRILVIDHHPQGLSRVVDPLRDAGYDVAVAQTAADGAASFGQFEPHLVFIAARLPRTHGTVLCRELKRTTAGLATPIILIVEGTGVQIDLPPLDQFGADRLMQKPVGASDLLEICSEFLGPPSGAAPDTQASDATQPADDGLSTALEELDTLDFDLPDEVVRDAEEKRRGATVPPVVTLAVDVGEDIADRLDELFANNEDEPAPQASATSSEPPAAQTDSVTHDDSLALGEFDLDGALEQHLGGTLETPAADTRPAAQPVERPIEPTPPKRQTAAAVQSRPQANGPATPRYQTSALTQAAQQVPSAVVKDALVPATSRRWVWAALPIVVGLVALVVFTWTRPEKAAPATTNAAHDSTQRVATLGSGLALPEEPAPFTPEEGPGELAEQATPEFTPQPAPAAKTVEPTIEPPVKIAAVSVPPKQAVRQITRLTAKPTPAPKAVAATEVEIVAPRAAPVPEPIKVPVEEPTETVAAATEVSAQEPLELPLATPLQTPAPIEIVETTPEPAAPIVAPVVEPAAVLPEPITRDPILVQRVDPRVADKDLKKGRGTIVLSLLVGTTGAVQRVIVEQGLSGSPLESAAVAAVLRWRYEPALERDEPVEAWTTAEFKF